MANKRVHEIAKEQNLSSKEVLEALVAAGYEVTAAASSIDEDVALRVLKGEAPSATKGAATGAATTKAPAARPAPRAPAPSPETEAGEGDQRVFEPDAPA
ncbi:MAG: translation initiation factor IF-2 N-terminal domain-containing protein, partial [Solirubrobacterales bacterium]